MKNEINDFHRPWPVPKRPWIAKQIWDNMLFLHWTIEAEQIKSQIPTGLELDLIDGKAIIGVVAFTTRHFRARFLPPIPFFSHFTEINVRTYVTVQNKPGVYFFSLNLAHMLLPSLTRLTFHSNHLYAKGSLTTDDDKIHFNCHRDDFVFNCDYWPTSEPFCAEPGTLEKWLIERYCFYSVNKKGKLYRAEILHKPFQLQNAEVNIFQNTVVDHGVPPFMCHYVKRNEVLIWNCEKLKDSSFLVK